MGRMTEYVQWARTRPHEGGMRPGGRRTTDIPLSPVHAGEADAEETICGLPTASLRNVGPWGGGGGGKCRECRAVADA